MASPAHTNKGEVETWCPRCLEREAAPNPKVPLEDPLREKFCQNVAIRGMKGGKAGVFAQGGDLSVGVLVCRRDSGVEGDSGGHQDSG